jgi:hypothetical protein
MGFLEIATRNANRGFRVHPLKDKEKAPRLNDWPGLATSNREVIEKWAAQYPNANVGVALGDDLCVLESDDVAELSRRLGVEDLQHVWVTYRVQATPGRPHLYFYQTDKTRSIGNRDIAGVLEFKQNRRYVVGEGSTHPSGATYQVIDPSPIIPFPDDLADAIIKLLTEHTSKNAGAPVGPIPVGGRHEHMTRIAGGLRRNGLDEATILQALIAANDGGVLSEPLHLDDLKHIAKSVSRYDVPPPAPTPTLGGKKPGQAMDPETGEDGSISVDVTANDAEELTPMPRPVYPDEVWDGTAYGDFADLCTADNKIPKRFFTESMRTVAGAIMGDRVICPSVDGVNPRCYTILIAPPGKGKGTACGSVLRFFEEYWRGPEREQPPLLFRNKSIYRTNAIGAQIINPASAPGLMKALEPDKPGKNKQPDPLDCWLPIPRAITINEEIRSLFSNFGLEATGAGLESVLCELYDRTTFSATATAQRAQAHGEVMFSLLGGITKDGWDAVFSKAQSTESGFLSRVNLIATEGEFDVTAGLDRPDFGPLQRSFLPRLLALMDTPAYIRTTPSARELMNEWFAKLDPPSATFRTRINIHAWRVALHLAWLKKSDYIDSEHVRGGIKVAEYQVLMREFYAPAEGDTRGARCQASIRRTMHSQRRLSLRELQKRTNAHRVGLGDWDKALKVLSLAGEVRIETAENGAKTVILLKTIG